MIFYSYFDITRGYPRSRIPASPPRFISTGAAVLSARLVLLGEHRCEVLPCWGTGWGMMVKGISRSFRGYVRVPNIDMSSILCCLTPFILLGWWAGYCWLFHVKFVSNLETTFHSMLINLPSLSPWLFWCVQECGIPKNCQKRLANLGDNDSQPVDLTLW